MFVGYYKSSSLYRYELIIKNEKKRGLVSSELEDTLFIIFLIILAPSIADFKSAMVGAFLNTIDALA